MPRGRLERRMQYAPILPAGVATPKDRFGFIFIPIVCITDPRHPLSPLRTYFFPPCHD